MEIGFILVLGLLFLVGGGTKPKTPTTPVINPGEKPTVTTSAPSGFTGVNPMQSSDPLQIGQLHIGDFGTATGNLDSGGGVSVGTASNSAQDTSDGSVQAVS